MADSFTLAKGEILRMVYTPITDGQAVTVDNTWDVASYMQRQGSSSKINLEPTIANDVINIEYDTVNLDLGTYNIDVRLTETGNDDVFSAQFFLHLVGTVTPPSSGISCSTRNCANCISSCNDWKTCLNIATDFSVARYV